MPRSKTGNKRQKPDPGNLERAAEAVKNGDLSQRKACKEYNVSRATLQRFLAHGENYGSFKKCAVNQIFSNEEEQCLARYLKTSAKMHYGLHRNQLRILAYEFATANKKKIPDSWENKKKLARRGSEVL